MGGRNVFDCEGLFICGDLCWQYMTLKTCSPLVLEQNFHFCQQIQVMYLNKSEMKWHGCRLGSQDSKTEEERLLQMYLPRPQGKEPQHFCEVLCRHQSGKTICGQREMQWAAAEQRPNSPVETAGLKPLCWSSLLVHGTLLCPGTHRMVSHLV